MLSGRSPPPESRAVARRSIPYPPSPTDFPEELTDPGRDSALEVVAVLSGLILFLLIYLGLAVGCVAVLVMVTTSLPRLPYPLLWILAAPLAAGVFLILLNGLFHRDAPDKNMHVEITEEEQPTFFAFLDKLTDEIGAPMPSRVFVTPEVTAAMMPEVSLLNLFVPPKKNLLVGLGLVNSLNLSEFKAVMGHEFGHFSQKTSRMHAYVYLTNRVMLNLLTGQDWLDRMIQAAHRNARRAGDASVLFFAAFAWGVGGPVWVVKKGLVLLFHAINFAALSLSRKNEFHADRVAVSVAGSNAIVHALARLEFAEESLAEAVGHLEVASQHDLYSRDLFTHHTAAAALLRKVRKKPRLGLPPVLKRPKDGRDVQVFEDDEESPVPEMWSTHPKNFDREENAKEIFVCADEDDRSPWELFADTAGLKERLTYRFYRVVFKVKKSVELATAREVQAFIDEEHAEVIFDPKYHESYDERFIFPGDLQELNQLVETEPWDAERIERVHGRLYRELGNRVEELRDLRKAMRKIYRKSFGRPRGRDRRRLEDLEEEFETLTDWFTSFDRRVYLTHAHMAAQTDTGRLHELVDRYVFHLKVQALHRDIIVAHDRVLDVVDGLQHFGSELPDGFFELARETFDAGRRAMRDCLGDAHHLRTPELANIKKGTRLDSLIFEYDLLREPPRTYMKGTWVNKLLNQMGQMRNRLKRMDFKSLGAILQMQDRLAVEWVNKVAPPGVVVDDPLPKLIVVEDPPVKQKPAAG
jgi:Zn-dependent protease with chaperone function